MQEYGIRRTCPFVCMCDAYKSYQHIHTHILGPCLFLNGSASVAPVSCVQNNTSFDAQFLGSAVSLPLGQQCDWQCWPNMNVQHTGELIIFIKCTLLVVSSAHAHASQCVFLCKRRKAVRYRRMTVFYLLFAAVRHYKMPQSAPRSDTARATRMATVWCPWCRHSYVRTRRRAALNLRAKAAHSFVCSRLRVMIHVFEQHIVWPHSSCQKCVRVNTLVNTFICIIHTDMCRSFSLPLSFSAEHARSCETLELVKYLNHVAVGIV